MRKTKGQFGFIFLFGKLKNAELSEKIKVESLENGDILQSDVEDSYRHLTYMVLLSFIWINKYLYMKEVKSKLKVLFTRFCGSKVEFISKMDDDTVLNFDNLVQSLFDIDQSENVIACPTVLRNQISVKSQFENVAD